MQYVELGMSESSNFWKHKGCKGMEEFDSEPLDKEFGAPLKNGDIL